MPGKKVIIVHFGELWLRGRNRGSYIKILKKRMLEQLEGEEFKLESLYDRFLIRPDSESSIESIRSKLSNLFGISTFELSFETEPDLDSIRQAAGKALDELSEFPVRINSHRSHKGFDFTSIDIIREIVELAKERGIETSNHGYKSNIYVSVTKEKAYITNKKERGLGGLPVGSSGRGVVLLSGGIDSPVAAWYAMKRGVDPIYVHVHAFSNNDEAYSSKISNILEILSRYKKNSPFYLIPSHLFQMAALKSGRYELVLLKSFMLGAADKIAKKEKAELIFTGESLGQVASQTASNLRSEQLGIKLPILRPLIGFDKEEIIKVARAIGTYDESVKEYKDVCSINSKNPKTHTSPEKLKEVIKDTGMRKVMSKSLKISSRRFAGKVGPKDQILD